MLKAYRFPEYDSSIVVGKNTVILGAGNVAMDSAQTALRLGANEEVWTACFRKKKRDLFFLTRSCSMIMVRFIR